MSIILKRLIQNICKTPWIKSQLLIGRHDILTSWTFCDPGDILKALTNDESVNEMLCCSFVNLPNWGLQVPLRLLYSEKLWIDTCGSFLYRQRTTEKQTGETPPEPWNKYEHDEEHYQIRNDMYLRRLVHTTLGLHEGGEYLWAILQSATRGR